MKKINIAYIVLLCLWISLFKISIMPVELHKSIRIISVGICIIYLFRNFKLKIDKHIVLWFGWIIISCCFAYFNNISSFTTFSNGLIYGVGLLCAYMLIKYFIYDNKTEYIVNSLYYFSLIINICSIIMIFIVGVNSKKELMYFIGGKFMTSYFFILYVVLFYSKYLKKIKHNLIYKLVLLLLVISCLLLILHIKCSTAAVGMLSLMILLVFFKKKNRLLMNSKVVIAIILFFGYIPFIINEFLSNNYVSYFITNVLGENLGLTGRLKIYDYLIQIIDIRKYTGYGYGNEIVHDVVGYGNAQNGLLDIAVSYGYVGIAFFCFMIYKCMNKPPKVIDGEESNIIRLLYALLYVFIVCSIVEISYNNIFYICIFMISQIYEHNKIIKKENEE